MISSCNRCWRLPCICGFSYEHMNSNQLEDLIKHAEIALIATMLRERKLEKTWRS